MLKRHKAFLKDYANIKLTDTQFEKLISFLALLKEGKELPPESKDHALKGNWKDFRECHLTGDILQVKLLTLPPFKKFGSVLAW